MRVDNMDINIRQSNPVGATGTSEVSRKGSRTATTAASTDQALFSGTSGLLSLALGFSEASGSSRVEELRQAIQSGSYSVNLPDLGRSIVDSALQYD